MSKIKTLKISEYFELIEYFRKNVVIGVECERAISMSGNILANHLKTSYLSYGDRDSRLSDYKEATTNDYNVAFIYPDNSFDGGNEIVFNGTAEKFDWVHEKLLKLEKKLDTLGCQNYNYKTSNHITLISLQDRFLNPIILVNLYNLVKAYSPAIYWLGSADSKSTIVRRGAGGYANLNYVNPIGKTFEQLKQNLGRGFVNFSKQKVLLVADEEVLSGIRIEFRSPDGMRVPSALTSLMFLFKALLYKALDLSTKGIVMTESLVDDWQKVKTMNSKIINNHEILDNDDRDYLRKLSKEMIEMLLPQLKMISPESIPILQELAKKPISQRTGKWVIIEKKLLKNVNKKLTENEEKLVQIVIGKEITEDTAGKWRQKVAKKFGRSTRMVEYMMKGIETKVSMRFVFDNEIKQYRLE